MKKLFSIFIFLNVFSVVFAQVDVEIPKGQVQMIDDFENGNFWIWAGSDWDKYDYNAVSCGVALSKEHITHGKYSMELMHTAIDKEGTAVWFYDGSQNLSNGNYIVADFYNPGLVEHKVSFVIQATPQWKWLQTAEYIIPKGKHTVVFFVGDISADFNQINRINIRSTVFPSCSEDSSLFVDNIRLIK